MSRFGLKEEEEVGVLLHFSIIGEMTLCRIDVFEMLFNFMLLQVISEESLMRYENATHFIKRHSVLDKETYTGV